jgi:hypothetical protein
MEGPYVYADTRFTDPADVGPLQALIEVTWENARASYTLPFTLVGTADRSRSTRPGRPRRYSP